MRRADNRSLSADDVGGGPSRDSIGRRVRIAQQPCELERLRSTSEPSRSLDLPATPPVSSASGVIARGVS